METVTRRVDRSVRLLDSLGSEKSRWQESSRAFEDSMSTISGDTVLAAAFLAYGGYFDQQFRQDMADTWAEHLTQASIKFKEDLSRVQYLSTAESRQDWQSHNLPSDDLSTENAIILSRFDRYPLIIDPSGQATSFLMQQYKDRKISVTSFLNEAFLKQLESALRFGTPLLIQDVEHLDPMLNPILNKELRRAGGRVLIRVGSQDIDFSPSFNLFLVTRDSSINFSPDICSRVTFVNFTMTPASLQSQTLTSVLRSERPETEEKRKTLLKLQGEFRLRLLQLERSLLQALNSSGNNILDDDNIIDSLEALKKEAGEVAEKVAETENVMQDVEAVTGLYQPLARACTSIYFALDRLSSLNHFYQFSLQHFLSAFQSVLQSARAATVQDFASRLQLLRKELYRIVFRRTCCSLLHQDQLVFATVLAQIKLQEQSGQENVELDTAMYESVGKGLATLPQQEGFEDGISTIDLAKMQEPEKANVVAWQHLDGMFIALVFTVLTLLLGHTRNLKMLRLIKAIRPDRFSAAMSSFDAQLLGYDLEGVTDHDLKELVETCDAHMPIAICSVPGLDGAYRVDDLVSEIKLHKTPVQCASVALGSIEGFTMADKAIVAAARQGSWVMLKNCHVSASLFNAFVRLKALTACTRMAFIIGETSTVDEFPSFFFSLIPHYGNVSYHSCFHTTS